MIKKLKKNEKGFTLVELVVVIAILAILALLLVPRIMGSVEDARQSRAESDARTITSEIATHNALAKVNGTPVLKPGGTIAKGDMPTIGRAESDWDNIEAAGIQINVDANGNPTMVTSTPTPAP